MRHEDRRKEAGKVLMDGSNYLFTVGLVGGILTDKVSHAIGVLILNFSNCDACYWFLCDTAQKGGMKHVRRDILCFRCYGDNSTFCIYNILQRGSSKKVKEVTKNGMILPTQIKILNKLSQRLYPKPRKLDHYFYSIGAIRDDKGELKSSNML